MNKKYLALALIIIVAVGIFFIKKDTTLKNVDALATKNNTPVIIEENVEYFPGAKGYFVRPATEAIYPGVVMIHENRGLRPETKQAAEQLAKEGYMVLAVDLLGGVAEDQDGAKVLTSKFVQKTGVENMKAATTYLRSKGAPKMASLGWCFGGRQSLELAMSGEQLDATVVYYGGGMATTTERLAPIRWPVLGIFGDKDQVIPITMVKDFETSMNTLGITNEIHIYPDVGHAFANPSGANYAPVQTKDAWEKTLTFLEQTLK